MGLCNSRESQKTANEPLKVVSQSAEQDEYEIDNPDNYDAVAIESLQVELKKDPNTFILNLLLMSFMFFEDFQEEMKYLANITSERAQKINSQLIECYQKQLITPDVVMEKVDKRVKFQSTGKAQLEPLVVQRMFILHDSIQMIPKYDAVDYNEIDKPAYRAQLEESDNYKGFARIKLLMDTIYEERRNSENSDNFTIFNEHRDVTKCTSNDSGFSTTVSSDSDYGYSRITAARTPNKLAISENDIYSHINQLPSQCVTPVIYRNMPEVNPEEQGDYNNESSKSNLERPTIELFRTVYFLNSEEFMANFRDNVFPNCLAETLGFSENSLSKATSVPGAIYCNIGGAKHDKYYEVLPCVPMQWPAELAHEWASRKRSTVRDKRTQIAYKWPTDNMVKEIKQLDTVLIPRGFIPKRDDNIFKCIEWEVVFPKAERHLEIRMSHAQMRLFLFIITLFKTHIEPITKNRGLLVEHIRILMFWECEANYRLWPENKLGTKLKLVLQNLYGYLGKENLSHYFIKDRNLFKNVPSCDLRYAQTVINEIIESPVLYMISALKKLKYSSEKFFPVPDLDKLYELLTADFAFQKMSFARNVDKSSKNNKTEDTEQKWNRLYIAQQRAGVAASKSLTDENHNAAGVNLEAPLKQLDLLRSALLLKFFITHFLKIAKRSSNLPSTMQALFYLKQAYYLTKLLEASDIESATAFQDRIKIEEDICSKRAADEVTIPSTPKRNSSNLYRTSTEFLQVKGKTINMRNLNDTFNPRSSKDQKSITSELKRKMNANKLRVNCTTDKITFAEVHEATGTNGQSNETTVLRKSVSFKSNSTSKLNSDDRLSV